MEKMVPFKADWPLISTHKRLTKASDEDRLRTCPGVLKSRQPIPPLPMYGVKPPDRGLCPMNQNGISKPCRKC